MVRKVVETYTYDDITMVTNGVFNSLLYMAETHFAIPHKKPLDILINLNPKLAPMAARMYYRLLLLELQSLLLPESTVFHEAVHYLAYREGGLFVWENIEYSVFSKLLNETLAELAVDEVYGHRLVYQIDFFYECQKAKCDEVTGVTFSNGIKIDKPVFDMLMSSLKLDACWVTNSKTKDKEAVLKEFIKLYVDNEHKLSRFIKICAIEYFKSLRNAGCNARTLIDRYKFTGRDDDSALKFYMEWIVRANNYGSAKR